MKGVHMVIGWQAIGMLKKCRREVFAAYAKITKTLENLKLTMGVVVQEHAGLTATSHVV